MSEKIPYGALMHKALRHLLADVLRKVSVEGLPGAHHFFIGFDTTHDGVGLSDRLREKFPEEMTVVMQDWFDDLVVTDDGFAVTLNFSDVPERLEIPFASIKTFVDPSVEFGLRFDAQEDELEGEIPLDPPKTWMPKNPPKKAKLSALINSAKPDHLFDFPKILPPEASLGSGITPLLTIALSARAQ